MGWTTMNSSKKVTQYFKEDYFNRPEKYEVLDIAYKNFTEVYAAVKVKTYEKPFVICFVFKVFKNGNVYGENFGYKDMDEFCGPGLQNCPERILNILTPIDEIADIMKQNRECDSHKWAKNWRKACYENIARSKKKSKIKNGCIIKTERPVRFSNGVSYEYFQKDGKRWKAISNLDNLSGVMVKFSMRNIEYKIVEEVGISNEKAKELGIGRSEKVLLNKLLIRKKSEVVKNFFTGEAVKLSPVAVALHDYIKGAELIRKDFSKELSLFRKLFPDEYYVLLD